VNIIQSFRNSCVDYLCGNKPHDIKNALISMRAVLRFEEDKHNNLWQASIYAGNYYHSSVVTLAGTPKKPLPIGVGYTKNSALLNLGHKIDNLSIDKNVISIPNHNPEFRVEKIYQFPTKSTHPAKLIGFRCNNEFYKQNPFPENEIDQLMNQLCHNDEI